jgi:hypothetical protein
MKQGFNKFWNDDKTERKIKQQAYKMGISMRQIIEYEVENRPVADNKMKRENSMRCMQSSK